MDRPSTRPVGGETRFTVLLLLAVALATSFFPILTASPAPVGKSDWSVVDFILAMRAGALPVADGVVDLLPLWLAYLALAVAPLLLWLPRYHVPVGLIAVADLLWSVRSIGRRDYFNSALRHIAHASGRSGDLQITYQPTVWVLPGVLVLILILLWNQRSSD